DDLVEETQDRVLRPLLDGGDADGGGGDGAEDDGVDQFSEPAGGEQAPDQAPLPHPSFHAAHDQGVQRHSRQEAGQPGHHHDPHRAQGQLEGALLGHAVLVGERGQGDDHLIGEGGGEADGEGGQDRAAGGVRPVQIGDDIGKHVGEGEEEEAAVGDDLEAGPGDGSEADALGGSDTGQDHHGDHGGEQDVEVRVTPVGV